MAILTLEEIKTRPGFASIPDARLEPVLDAANAWVEKRVRHAVPAPADLVKVTVYVAGVEHWPAFDRVYAAALGEHRPARAVVPVPELHHGYLVEIEAIARYLA